MSDAKLTVNVSCIRPDWAINNPIDKFNDVRYRLYVNEELFTERTWIWPNSYQLLENLWTMNDQQQYTVRVEPVLLHPNQAKFQIENLKISNLRYQTINVNDCAITVQIV